MDDRVVFEKMGLRLGTVYTRARGRPFETSEIRGYIIRKDRESRELGLLVSTIFFSVVALLFLIPIIEELLRPKFLFVVVVGVFLASVSIQDFFAIKNPGEFRLMLVTPYGARIGLQTTSTTVLEEAKIALEKLGISQTTSVDAAAFRMKATANGTSSAS